MRLAKMEKENDERWLAIPGYEGWYDVSDSGRVRRARKTKGARIGHVRKMCLAGRGYLHVTLYRGGRHTLRCIAVHRLVAAAFLGECPQGLEVDHIDGNRLNNAASNLRYIARQENLDARRRTF